MKEHEHIQQLYQQFIQGQISPAGLTMLFDYFKVSNEQDLRALIETGLLLPDDTSEASHQEQQALARIDAAISNHLGEEQPHAAIIPYPPKIPRYRWISVAAAILLLAVYYFWQPSWMNKQPDIAPGYNQATLALADGTTVNLDSAQSGIIINEENIKYNNGNNVLSEKGRGPRASGTYNVARTTYNSLSTPKGGQYQIILPDGTKVWLNAASTLKYPSKFTGDGREVFLEGEAYFEVNNKMAETHSTPLRSAQGDAKRLKPFIVNSKNQEILVLGTSFNVTAFADEKETKTTLVEGKVQVRSENLKLKTYNVQLLAPMQQAMVKGDSLTVSTVNVHKETAWRNGLIAFNDETLEAIMRKIARWYNIEVTYSPDANRRVQISGSVSRYVNISDVLKRLELTGFAHFTVEGRRILVAK